MKQTLTEEYKLSILKMQREIIDSQAETIKSLKKTKESLEKIVSCMKDKEYSFMQN